MIIKADLDRQNHASIMVVKYLLWRCFSLLVLFSAARLQRLTVKCILSQYCGVHNIVSNVQCNLGGNIHRNATVEWSGPNCTLLAECKRDSDDCNETTNNLNNGGLLIFSASRNIFTMYSYENGNQLPIIDNIIFSVFQLSSPCLSVSFSANISKISNDECKSFRQKYSPTTQADPKERTSKWMTNVTDYFNESDIEDVDRTRSRPTNSPSTLSNQINNVSLGMKNVTSFINVSDSDDIECKCPRPTDYLSTEHISTRRVSAWTTIDEDKEDDPFTSLAPYSSAPYLTDYTNATATSHTSSVINTSPSTSNSRLGNAVRLISSDLVKTISGGTFVGFVTILSFLVWKRLIKGRCRRRFIRLKNTRGSLTEQLIYEGNSIGMFISPSDSIPLTQLQTDEIHFAERRTQTTLSSDVNGVQVETGQERNVESDDASKQMSPLPAIPISECSRHLFQIMDEEENGRSLVVATSREENKTSFIHVYESVDDDDDEDRRQDNVCDNSGTCEQSLNDATFGNVCLRNPYAADIHSRQTLKVVLHPEAGKHEQNDCEDGKEERRISDSPSGGSSDSTSSLNLLENVVYSRCSTHTYQSIDDRDSCILDLLSTAEGLASDTVDFINLQTSIEETQQQGFCEGDIHSCQTLRIQYSAGAGLNEQSDDVNSTETKRENVSPSVEISDSTFNPNLCENVAFSRCSTHTYQSVDDRANYSQDRFSIAEGMATDSENAADQQAPVENTHRYYVLENETREMV